MADETPGDAVERARAAKQALIDSEGTVANQREANALLIRYNDELLNQASIKDRLRDQDAKTVGMFVQELQHRVELIKQAMKLRGIEEDMGALRAKEISRRASEPSTLGVDDKALERFKLAETAKGRLADMYSGAKPIGEGLSAAGKVLGIDYAGQMSALRGQVSASMTGANVAGGGAAGMGFNMMGFGPRGGAAALSSQMFGGISSSIMAPDEKMSALLKVLKEAPLVAGETTASMTTLIGTLANFGLSVDESMDMVIKASRNNAMGAKDVAQVYRAANVISRDLGLSTRETANELIDMTTALRKVGGNSSTAQGILNVFNKDITAMGQSLSAVEKMGFAKDFAKGMGGMSLATAAGLKQFTSGQSIQSMNPEDLSGKNLIRIAKDTFDKIQANIGQSPMEKLLATSAMGSKLFGINAQSPQAAEAFYKIMSSGDFNKDMETKLDLLSDPAGVTARGIDALQATINPLISIDNNTKWIQTFMAGGGLMQMLAAIAPLLAGTRMAGSLIGAGEAYGAGALISPAIAKWGGRAAAGAAPLVAEGFIGAGALAALGPYVVPAAVIGGIAIGGNMLMNAAAARMDNTQTYGVRH